MKCSAWWVADYHKFELKIGTNIENTYEFVQKAMDTSGQ